jgi:hypothetical protein
MIALYLIRIAMLEASCLISVSIAQLSFARAPTETRLLFKILVSNTDAHLWPPSGQQLCYAVLDTVYISSKAANSPGIGRNIAEIAAAWKNAIGDADPRTRRELRCRQDQKPAKAARARLFS